MDHKVYYDKNGRELNYKDVLYEFLDDKIVVAELVLSFQESITKPIEKGIYAFNLFDGSLQYLGHNVTEYDKLLLGNDIFIRYSRGVFIPSHLEIIEELREYKDKEIQKKLEQEYKRGTKKIRVYDLILILLGCLMLLQVFV